jgi:hypothetical protein
MTMANSEDLARVAYTTYCAAVGGVSYNGDPLPSWEQQRGREDQKIPDAWVAAANAVVAELEG